MKIISPIFLYKLSRFFYVRKIIFLSKVIDYLNRLIFSCWLPGSAVIGDELVLGYLGLSIVLHKDCVVGNNVHIDQGVTIGGNAVDEGVPRIGSNVYIGAGAKILGRIQIGNDVVVAANAVVIESVPDGCVVVGVPGRVVKRGIKIKDFLFHL